MVLVIRDAMVVFVVSLAQQTVVIINVIFVVAVVCLLRKRVEQQQHCGELVTASLPLQTPHFFTCQRPSQSQSASF